MRRNTIEDVLSALNEIDRGYVTPCWIWQRYTDKKGYGRVKWSGKLKLVHRLVYVEMGGVLADEEDLDHLCHTHSLTCAGGPLCLHRPCARPDHLQPVTQLENWERGLSITAEFARRTHCDKGHALIGENLIVQLSPNGRVRRKCLTCRRDYDREYQRMLRASAG